MVPAKRWTGIKQALKKKKKKKEVPETRTWWIKYYQAQALRRQGKQTPKREFFNVKEESNSW